MWYVLMFSGLAILCVVVVLIRNARTKAGELVMPKNAISRWKASETYWLP